jgi:hypothetical protein
MSGIMAQNRASAAAVFRRFARTPLAGLALTALALGSTGARANVEGNCGALVKINYAVVDTDKFSTNSKTFVAIPNATVHFVQSGTTPGCAIVRFSAETLAPEARFMIVRPVLQGSGLVPVLPLPPEIWLSDDYIPGADLLAYGARSFEFVFPNVQPGPHVIVMQMRSHEGRPVVIRRSTTTVQHR